MFTEIINFIDDYTLVVNLLALLFFQIFTRKLTSFTLIMIGVLVLDFLHKGIASEVKQLFTVAEFKPYLGLLWYIPFAVTNCLMVVTVAYLVNRMKLLRDRVTISIMVMYLFLTVVQTATFFDVWVIKTDVLYDHYPMLIVSSNVFVTLLAACFALRAGLIRYSSSLLFFIRR